MAAESPTQEHQDQEELHCHWCAVPLDEDGRCPKCRRRQVKVCFCGEELRLEDEVCPQCGADWTGVVKVVHRRRRRALSGIGVARAAAIGLLAALLLTALASSIVARLALDSAESTDLPEAPADRLGLAWKTVADTVTKMAEAFASRAGGAAPIILLGIVGALISIFLYLRREGAFALRRQNGPPETHHQGRHRRPR